MLTLALSTLPSNHLFILSLAVLVTGGLTLTLNYQISEQNVCKNDVHIIVLAYTEHMCKYYHGYKVSASLTPSKNFVGLQMRY